MDSQPISPDPDHLDHCNCCGGIVPPVHSSARADESLVTDGSCPGHVAELGGRATEWCGAFDAALCEGAAEELAAAEAAKEREEEAAKEAERAAKEADARAWGARDAEYDAAEDVETASEEVIFARGREVAKDRYTSPHERRAFAESFRDTYLALRNAA